ncbi:MAG: amidohydrolase family protein [Defluviitaleaceae bacterium]|nr:amidohydrolase family protein [Defluviitaleaceae bacterium]
MRIIDAHMHFSNVSAFYDAAKHSGVDYSREGYLKECEKAGIIASVCMGLGESAPGAFPDHGAQNPMLADLAENPPQIYTNIGINPHDLGDAAIARILAHIDANPRVVGFKIYAGYYHFMIHDPVYDPVYRIATERGLTVAIHTGDTYSERGLLEFSHPLAADRLAMAWRGVNFVLCHMGDPWIMDACEVAYKNPNVFVDISGLLAGDGAHIAATEARPPTMHHYTQGINYLNNYKKVLFGTDWPLVPLAEYVNFCKKLMPPSAYEDVFYNNAANLFGIGK